MREAGRKRQGQKKFARRGSARRLLSGKSAGGQSARSANVQAQNPALSTAGARQKKGGPRGRTKRGQKDEQGERNQASKK